MPIKIEQEPGKVTFGNLFGASLNLSTNAQGNQLIVTAAPKVKKEEGSAKSGPTIAEQIEILTKVLAPIEKLKDELEEVAKVGTETVQQAVTEAVESLSNIQQKLLGLAQDAIATRAKPLNPVMPATNAPSISVPPAPAVQTVPNVSVNPTNAK
jgi:hypothetical protein